MKLRLIPLVVFTIAALAACGSDDAPIGDNTSVSGTVLAPTGPTSTGELPAGSELIIRLEDISRADATAKVVSEQTIDLTDNEFPISFVLDYDESDIDERNLYRVSARVEASGDLVMISDTVIPVITRGAPTTDVDVALVLVATP